MVLRAVFARAAWASVSQSSNVQSKLRWHPPRRSQLLALTLLGRVRDMNTSIASNHASTAMELSHKGIIIQQVPQTPPPQFNDIWEKFRKELVDAGIKELPPADKALDVLSVPLNTVYLKEVDFDKALFNALRLCVKGNAPFQNEEENTIMLRTNSSYAIGIARQTAGALNLSAGAGDSISSTNNSGLSSKSATDHAVCVFEKRDDAWKLTDCFSVVELKMNDSNCKPFHILSDGTYHVDLSKKHAALGQVMMYNMGCILLHRAKRGVLGNRLPLVIIAGLRVGADVARAALRWVSGDIVVPDACGGRFHYTIKDFGYFHSSKSQNDWSIEQALSLYIETILFGWIDAKPVYEQLVQGNIPLAGPASGRCPMIGDLLFELPLCASPIPGAVGIEAADQQEHFRVSQGELFKGTFNVFEALQRSDMSVTFAANERTNANLLIKVCSPTVHTLLIHPLLAYGALEVLKGANKALVKEVGSVLHAAVYVSPGMMTIMKDLTAQGYKTLKPESATENIEILWRGFSQLVTKLLLPMAAMKVVHTDIRPGYDFTANVLYQVTKDRKGLAKATMKLIDYESLVRFKTWTTPYLDGRYIRPESGWDATTYVWWQCMAVAFSWKEKLSTSILRAEDGMGTLKKYLREDQSGPAWLAKYRDHARSKIVTDKMVKDTLKKLAKDFEDVSGELRET